MFILSRKKPKTTFKLYDKDGNSIVDTSGYQSYVENTSAGGRIDRITGKLVSIEGNKQASGVMLDISATSLVSGTGMKITSGEKMTSGKLLDLVTTSSQAQEGVFSLAADSVEDGVIVKISSDQIKRGSIVDIETNTASLDVSSKLINL